MTLPASSYGRISRVAYQMVVDHSQRAGADRASTAHGTAADLADLDEFADEFDDLEGVSDDEDAGRDVSTPTIPGVRIAQPLTCSDRQAPGLCPPRHCHASTARVQTPALRSDWKPTDCTAMRILPKHAVPGHRATKRPDKLGAVDSPVARTAQPPMHSYAA